MIILLIDILIFILCKNVLKKIQSEIETNDHVRDAN